MAIQPELKNELLFLIFLEITKVKKFNIRKFYMSDN